jgi:hypothetical protein
LDGSTARAGRGRDRQPVELLGRNVGLAAHDQPGPVEQLAHVAAQLREQDRFLLRGGRAGRGCEVEQEHEHAGPFDVAEEAVAQAPAGGGAFDQPRNVGEHELVLVEAHDAEVGHQRGERVVGDLRLGRAHCRDQRRLARVREADDRGIGHELQLESQPAVLAVLALLGERGRPPRVREELRVAAAALPAPGCEPEIAVMQEVGQHRAVAVAHNRAFGDVDDQVGPARAVALVATPVHTRRRPPVRVVTEGEERGHVAAGPEPHVAALAAVAAVGTTLRRV